MTVATLATDPTKSTVTSGATGEDEAGETTVWARTKNACSQDTRNSGLPTVADSPMRCTSRLGDARETFQHRQQVPATVVPGEGVDLVDDHGL